MLLHSLGSFWDPPFSRCHQTSACVSLLSPHTHGITSCLCPQHVVCASTPPCLSCPRAVVPACTTSSGPSLQLGFLMIFFTKESSVGPAERKSKDVLCAQSGSLVCWFKRGRGRHLRASEWCWDCRTGTGN